MTAQRGGPRHPVSAETISAVLVLAKLYKHDAIAKECGISQPMVSKILVRYGQRRVLTKRARVGTV